MPLISEIVGGRVGALGAMIAARPIYWLCFVLWVAACGVSTGQYLDRRPLVGTAWAAASVSAFAIMLAIG